MMKRILHALAALWPVKTEDRSRETEDRGAKTEEDRSPKTEDRWKTEEDRSWKTVERGLSHEGPWLPKARNGLLRHLSAMMRMGETVRELATRECTHVPSRESAKRQPSESANLQISSTNQQIDEPTPKNTDNHLPKRVIVSEHEQPAERIGEPLPIAQVLARIYLRDAPRCAMGEAEAKAGPTEQLGSASSDPAKPNSQPLSLASGLIVPLASWVLALFMCLLSAQQVSAQAEPAAAAVQNSSKSFSDIIPPTAKSQYGMLGVHEFEGKFYLEIPDSLLGRDLLAVNRLAEGWAGDRPFDPFLNLIGYSGDLAGETLFRFDKEEEGSLNIYLLDYTNRIYNSHGMPRLLPNAEMMPIYRNFPIISRNASNDASVIDGADFIHGDNEIMTFSKSLRKKFGVGAMNALQSSYQGMEVTPTHTVTSSVKTYAYRNGKSVRLGMRSTWFLLPAIPYARRKLDERIGYYSFQITDYTQSNAPPSNYKLIKRWRLEPSLENREAYHRGELVEPDKPIVFYIDPAMPEEWVPFMLDGINEWQDAFIQAGFKNAIRGEVIPPDKAAAMIGDARYSIISYKPSHIANATAEIVVDPRSGEIVNAHIAWHHGVIRNVQQRLLIQGAIQGQKIPAYRDPALLGRVIQNVVAHEVGHCLGLLHNFGASSAVPVNRLRDSKWLAENAISPSIMDYVRVNFVAQPEDNVKANDIFPRIGDYDKWAIEWGYRYAQEGDGNAGGLTPSAPAFEGNLWFGHEKLVDDPRCQAEDLSDEPVKAAYYGMKNLRTVAENISDTVKNLEEAKVLFDGLFLQYSHYIRHATLALNSHDAKSEEALGFLHANLFRYPKWLALNVREDGNEYLISKLNSLQAELFPLMLARLLAKRDSPKMAELQDMIWQADAGSGVSSIYRRQLQLNYARSINQKLNHYASKKPNPEHDKYLLLQLHRLRLLSSIIEPRKTDANPLSLMHFDIITSILDHEKI